MATFLFIHGAWHASWCWTRIIPFLKQAGHTVLAPSLPGRGEEKMSLEHVTLKSYTQLLKDLVCLSSERVIVVSHSFGGVIATQLANEIPSLISKLVYICAFVPQHQQSLFDLSTSLNHPKAPAAMHIDEVKQQISLNLSQVGELFFNCCSKEDQAWAASQLCKEPLCPMTEQVHLDERILQHIPKIYIECTQDNALTIQAQRAMHSKYQCQVLSLNTDHSPFLSVPMELTQMLVSLNS